MIRRYSSLPPPALPPGSLRPPVVAGSWYPGSPEELLETVDDLLAVVQKLDGQPLGLIVPHAGYSFSGPVAARGFKQLAGSECDVAVIIAADHQLPVSDPISVWAEGGFETPLGVVPVDVELAGALITADARITFDPAAHAGEHPIEMELPFLQRICPECRIVPILMGADDEKTVAALADALQSALCDRRAVVIASSDLSHYPRQQDARRVDKALLAAVETGDPIIVRSAIAAIEKLGLPGLITSACGKGPILVAMQVAQALGANTTTILGHANSADSPQGDAEQVVGYGAVMFWRYDSPDLTAERQETLLALARQAIVEHLQTGQTPLYETYDSVLTRRAGVFVTLQMRDWAASPNRPPGGPEMRLRGCIGRLWADQPLYQGVQKMAVAAAADPRFPPLTVEELDELQIEISVLSPLRRLTDIQQLEIGLHGLVISGAEGQGLLLPEVAATWGWDRAEFLDNLCRKAGLPLDSWPDKAALYTFTTIKFGEEPL